MNQYGKALIANRKFLSGVSIPETNHFPRSAKSPFGAVVAAVVVISFVLSPMLIAQSNGLESKAFGTNTSTNTPLSTNRNDILFDEHCVKTIIGKWRYSATNALQWMTTKTEYCEDGTYIMQGDVGSTESRFKGQISNSGTWRIQEGYLCTTVTNNAQGKRLSEVARDKIISIDTNTFIYLTERNEMRTVFREQK